MGRYKSFSRGELADRHFPVRVRVAVPANGFGSQLNTILSWLDEHIGKAGHWHSTASSAYGAQSVFFYFLTVAAATAFMDQFRCELSVVGDWEEPRDMHGGGVRHDGPR